MTSTDVQHWRVKEWKRIPAETSVWGQNHWQTDMQEAGLGQQREALLEAGSRLHGQRSERVGDREALGSSVSSREETGLLGRSSGLKSLRGHSTPNTCFIFNLYPSHLNREEETASGPP